jgi:hypothetical protein
MLSEKIGQLGTKFCELSRVARWYIFKPKIKNWVLFGGSCSGSCWYIFRQLVYFTAIWYTLRAFEIFCSNLDYFSPFLYVVYIKKNLATSDLRSEN